jgi:hypothetical protein
MRWAASLRLIVLIAGALPAVARAQPAAAPEADRLFREGRVAAKAGDARLACDKFRASLQLEHATGTLISLGDCEEKLGHWVSALADLRQAAAELPPGDDRHAPVRDRIAFLEKHLPRLTIRTRTPLPAGARVFRDDAEVAEAAFGVAIEIDPGAHRVRVVVAGEPDRVSDVHLAEGEQRELWLGERAAQLVGPPPPKVTAVEGSPLRTLGWISVGTGSAALVIGAVTGLLVLDAKNDVARECDAARACSQEGLDALQSGPTYSTVSTISFVTAAAAGAIGVYLLLTHPAASATGVARSRALGPGAQGWSLGGTFQ